ncbi:MAG: SH3 domain-containing protein [Muribaculaceae bacterium]|nr:SH3 domain-containing protein [Muribaculaceae bacterium]
MNKMLKKLTFLLAAMLMMSVATASAQSMKMVVDSKGNVVGRYVKTNKTTYTVDVQDTYDVPMKGLKVVTFSAKNGQGVVYRDQTRKGNINVRKGPSTNTAVVAKIPEYDGVPETFPCLGKVNGWYKIRIHGKVGYVREDLAEWDGMSSF